MDKDLELRIGHLFTDLTDLLKRQFPGQNNPLCAKPVPEFHRPVVGGAGLGADMNGQIGLSLPYDLEYAGIRYDHPVDPGLDCFLQKGHNLTDILVMGNDIHGQICFLPMFMGIGYPFFHLVKAEIIGSGTQPK